MENKFIGKVGILLLLNLISFFGFSSNNHEIELPPDWNKLGGSITNEPTIVAMRKNWLNIFARGKDGAAYSKYWNGSKWSNWVKLGGDLPANAKISAVSWADNRIDLFVRGKDKALYHMYWNGNRWSKWESLGGQITNNPSVVSWGPGRLDIFARGTDGQMWHKLFYKKWGNWNPLGGNLPTNVNLSVTSWGVNRLDIFAKGLDSNCYHQAWTGSRWTGWKNLNKKMTSEPAAISWGTNRLDVFVRGTDGKMWHQWWGGNKWGTWESLGGDLPTKAKFSVTSWAKGRLDIFAKGKNGQLYHHWFSGKWGKWESLGGQLRSNPSAVAWGNNRLDIVVRGTDNGVWQMYWDGRKWGNQSSPNKPLKGWVDMHAHPMAHLAFGGKVLHGAPDVGTLMPVLPGCKDYGRPKNINEALSSCKHTHGGHGVFDNPCGDHLRKQILRGIEPELGASTQHHEENAFGYPNFKGWPARDNLTHQQMYVDWIKRNYDNGQRVMVALAVNNATYSALFSGSGDINPDDVSSANVQIEEMKKMVGRHTWMEIAYTANDLKRIISQNKFAVVLGIEVDNIGNFHEDGSINEMNPSGIAKTKVKREIDRLYRQGIRYIFPVHVVDNKFAGTAVYESIFNMSNYHQAGKFWDIGCAAKKDGISYQYEQEGFDVMKAFAKIKAGIDILRNPPAPPRCIDGHVNKKGLTNLGIYAIKEMMKKGMIIDLDHMSQKAVNESLSLAEKNKYPVNAGHNGLRASGSKGNERNFTKEQFNRIFKLKGMVGIGTADIDANQFIKAYDELGKNSSKEIVFALGTDANGMEKLPRKSNKRYNIYSKGFEKSRLGNKTWDYYKDGVAHYGMFSDFLADVAEKHVFVKMAMDGGAERFHQMWQKCETSARKIN